MSTPENMRYTRTHECAFLDEDGNLVVGITDHAKSELGDVVFIEIPEEGREVVAEEACAVIESVKVASDLYSPIAGTIVAVNTELEDDTELLSEGPHENGWLFKLQPASPADFDELLSKADYDSFVESGE